MPSPNADHAPVSGCRGCAVGPASVEHFRVRLAIFMRTGFETWWGSVSALVSRRISVACERWMGAMERKPCRADRIFAACKSEGKMTSLVEVVSSVISVMCVRTCMSEGFWKCD